MADTSGAAQLVSFNGMVSVERDSRSLWALNVNDYVHPGEVIVTGRNGSAMFRVADGSFFEVFPNSKVVFRANRANWQDLIELWLGKVRVQIEHPGGVPNNNKVRTPSAVISVRGTIFDVDYDDESGITTVLDEEGSVDVARALRLDDHKLLGPAETIRVYKNQPLAKASFDKGGLLQKIYHSAMDALTQEAINLKTGSPVGTPAGTSAGTATSVPATGGTAAGDKNNGPTAPPPPPPGN